MSRKKVVLLFVVLAVVALAAYLLSHRGKQASSASRGAAAAGASVPVQVSAATRGDLDLVLTLVGRVEAWSTVTLRARVSGQLQSLGFTPGAHVHKGDVLAQIDPRLLKAQLDQARGVVARDRAQLQKARADQQRYTDLLAKGFVSQADFDTYKANLAVARAALQSDLATQELAQTQLDYARIVAPFDGVVGAPLVWPGAQVTSDATDLFVLNQDDPVRVTFAIPQDSLPAVRTSLARGAVTVQATVAGDHGRPLRGTLEFIDNAVDASTSTITLKAHFDNAARRLTPGQYVQVSLPTTHLAGVVTVPVPALQSSSKGSFVFVLGADGTVQQRYVETGPAQGDRQVIDKGVAPGEQVVIEGQMLLANGARAHVAK
ncbi:efflux RND transporter periplasmic adaptor subunit [Dyella ginsengisoli]|uniref:Efflux RND transporter periplasmic adaptor subunit n=1 Tax=Dyella ginsengisoli TaxID=363848 RepID=A0ABW8JP99_9GAMM